MTRSDLADVPVSWSWLKEMPCPAKARHRALMPDGGEQSLAMRMGRGVHAKTFGTPQVHVFRGAQRRGKEWDAFKAAAELTTGGDPVILNERENEIAAGMAAALRNDPVANPLLFGPGVEHEVPMEWTVDGRAYRTRGIDFLRRGHWIGELKQARTVDPEKFTRDTLRALYPAQVEIYDEGEAILSKRDRARHPVRKLIIAVEPVPPHVVVVYELAPSSVRKAVATIGRYRSILATCEESNVWPGYSQGVWSLEVEESLTFADDDDGEEMAPDAGPFVSATWPTTDGDPLADPF